MKTIDIIRAWKDGALVHTTRTNFGGGSMTPKLGSSRFNMLLQSVALSAAILVAGCGGSEDSTSPDAKGTTATETAARVRAPQVLNLLPADAANWDQDTECTNASDFIKVVSGMHDKSMLMSRHRHCSTLVSDAQPIVARIVQAPGGAWSLYTPGAIGNIEEETLGYAVLETQYQAYGPSNRLEKSYAVKVKVAQWTVNPTARVSPDGHRLFLNATINCNGTSGMNLTEHCTQSPLPENALIDVSLAAGAESTKRVFNMGFSWTSSSETSYQSYGPDLTQYIYQVNGTKVPAASTPFYTQGNDGSHQAPFLRCDKGLAKGGTEGCVFPEAAAVFVMDMAINDMKDATEHVFHAQKGLGTNESQRSPGVLSLHPNSRVIPVLTSDQPQLKPLKRIADHVTINKNRRHTCQNIGSMFNSLPRQNSSSCPSNESDCNCDEYPFASTSEGGRNPWSSVRRISSEHNSRAGGYYGEFLSRQRVIAEQSDPFFVYVKNAPTGPILTVARKQMVAGQPYHVDWRTEGVSSVSYECTAGGTGFWGAGNLELGPVPAPNGWYAWYVDGVASPGWVAYPSTCHWKGNGQILFTEILETFAGAAPALEIERSPMQANQQFSVSWLTSGAVSLHFKCTSTEGGYTGEHTYDDPAQLNWTSIGVASAAWVGHPSECVWTAMNAQRKKTIFEETVVTNP